MDMDDAFNLCVKGCGFYGRVENRNMCSKCYKDFIMEEIILCDILDTQNNILPPFKCFLTSDARLSMAASRHCMTRSRSASELIGSPSTCRI
ncbi:hypothetical protein G4B88_027270 [Cannabis sativa]|uniref:A20-type domain-containing protein n=1 Tax=Cannabis sativa TaxID=3483 RepID=A0A7J6HT53_CANSA|nr:hypothetical protein G4B88_027270 [Cannabis sativa]